MLVVVGWGKVVAEQKALLVTLRAPELCVRGKSDAVEAACPPIDWAGSDEDMIHAEGRRSASVSTREADVSDPVTPVPNQPLPARREGAVLRALRTALGEVVPVVGEHEALSSPSLTGVLVIKA